MRPRLPQTAQHAPLQGEMPCGPVSQAPTLGSPPHKQRLAPAHRFSMREMKERIATLALGLSSLGLALAPIIFLFWLMQPKVLINPGIGALRVAGAASFEPFLQQPPQAAESPRRESPARLAQNDPRVREATNSA